MRAAEDGLQFVRLAGRTHVHMTNTRLVSVFALLFCGAACGGSSSPPTGTPTALSIEPLELRLRAPIGVGFRAPDEGSFRITNLGPDATFSVEVPPSEPAFTFDPSPAPGSPATVTLRGDAYDVSMPAGSQIELRVVFQPTRASVADGLTRTVSFDGGPLGAASLIGEAFAPVLELRATSTTLGMTEAAQNLTADLGAVPPGFQEEIMLSATNPYDFEVPIHLARELVFSPCPAGPSGFCAPTPSAITVGQSDVVLFPNETKDLFFFTFSVARGAAEDLSSTHSIPFEVCEFMDDTASCTTNDFEVRFVATRPDPIVCEGTDFGTVELRDLLTRTATCTNVSDVALEDVQWTVEPEGLTEFAVVSAPGVPMAPDAFAARETRSIATVFVAANVGPQTGQLLAQGRFSDLEFPLELSNTTLRADVRAQPELALDPVAIDFGPVTVGSSVERTVTAINTGNVPITIESVAPSGPFSAPNFSPLVLLPQASGAFVLRFEPTSDGPITGSLTLTTTPALSPPRAIGVSGIAREDATIEQVSAARSHACMRRANGDVLCWGRGFSGQLGNGSTNMTSLEPILVPLFGNGAAQLELGLDFTCIIRANSGVVSCWGDNRFSQVGDGSGLSFVARPSDLTLPAPAVDLGVGEDQACAVLSTGEVHCWGNNTDGMISATAGARVDTPTPILESNGMPLRNAERVDVHDGWACAVVANGSNRNVVCWGRGPFGLNGQFVGPTAPTPLVTGAVPINDAVDVMLQGDTGPSGGTTFGCLMRSSLSMFCFGANPRGQLGRMTSTSAAGPGRVSMPNDTVLGSAGGDGGCAVDTLGFAYCWGSNRSGNLGAGLATGSSQFEVFPQRVIDHFTGMPLGGPTNPVVQISAGPEQSCAVLDDGQVWCWGFASGGHLGDLQGQFEVGLTGAPRRAAVPLQGSYRATVTHELGYCQDTIDNDGDGLTDHDDPDCLEGDLFANGGTGNLDGAGNDIAIQCGAAGSNSVGVDHVWRWVAPSTGMFEFESSDFSTIVSVYDDRSLGNELACFNTRPTSSEGRFTLNATANTTYFVAVDQNLGAGPTYTLRICPGTCP